MKTEKLGFSLMEVLVVMSIMVVLIALLVPPAGRILNGISVTSAGQLIQNRLALARQLAISRNRIVEVRFYEVPSSNASGQTYFAMLQCWIYDQTGANPTPLDKITALTKNMVLDAKAISGTATTLYSSSTLIDSAPDQGTQTIPSLGNASLPYRAFRFRGNGATNLGVNGTAEGNTWYLTVRPATDLPTADAPPKNYYTIQIDPLTGQTKTFRP